MSTFFVSPTSTVTVIGVDDIIIVALFVPTSETLITCDCATSTEDGINVKKSFEEIMEKLH